LLTTGSEVSVCLTAAEELAEQGVHARVVALPCWTCFEEQGAEYREGVLRRDLPSLAVEAGSTLGWSRYAQHALGIDTFGTSAPGAYVFEYCNITPDAVVAQVLEQLEEDE
jgi:transketolase